ncbi:hypothetical protein ACXYMU_12585 [Pontibacter sp. CAU 1760]
MNELREFSVKLLACDFIALTPVNEDRMYCRFYLDKLYKDRMIIIEPVLLKDLALLCKVDEIVKDEELNALKNKYSHLENLVSGKTTH